MRVEYYARFDVAGSSRLSEQALVVDGDDGPAAVTELLGHIPLATLGLTALDRPRGVAAPSIAVPAVDDDGDQRGQPAEFVAEMRRHRGEVTADDDRYRDTGLPSGLGRLAIAGTRAAGFHGHTYSHFGGEPRIFFRRPPAGG
jgi:hypothetical protein